VKTPQADAAPASLHTSATDSTSRLIASGLKKAYGSRLVVKDVSLSVDEGEVVGLLGPNGAGKTTSFYMLVGLLRSDAGQILLDGQPIEKMPIHQRARLGLGYLPQEASIFRKLNVGDNVRAVLELQHDAAGRSLSNAAIEQRLTQLLTDLHVDHAPRRRPRVPVVSGAAWKLRARWPPTRVSSCLMNRSPGSTRLR
jgi:lipopolysaccharide export system ATP-binding protein